MSNLPDDVSPSDIDRHFGEPETRTVHGTVEVAVSIDTQFFDEKRECEQLLMEAFEENGAEAILDASIEEIEP